MSTVDTVTIPESKIKFRFSEPYASEAANIQQGVNLPGAYRGAEVEAAPSPNQTVLIKVDSGGEMIVLHHNTLDGYCTVVRETSDVTIECSGLTWPTVAETTVYVFMEVDYTLGADTSGNFKAVTTPLEVPDDAVMLAKVVIPAGVSTIIQDYIKTDGSNRTKVARKKGVIVTKRVEIPTTASPRVRFQIPDKVCWMGTGSSPLSRVRLGDNGISGGTPLVGSDGGQIMASSWYDVETGGSILTDSDLDEDGCYTNPWVSMNFSDTVDTYNTGQFSAWYWAYVPFDELDAVDRNGGFFETHTNSVMGRDHADTPDSVTKGSLDDQLDDLLALINARIRTYNPDAAGSTWHLLWRSNNVVNDADVDNDTMSLYWSDSGMAIAQGGYLDGSNFKIDATGSTGNVSLIRFEDGSVRHMSTLVSSLPFSASINLAGAGSWTNYRTSDGLTALVYNDISNTTFYEAGRATMSGTPDVGSNPLYIEMLSLSGGNIRAYWGGNSDTDDNEFVLAWGARWDDTAANWEPTSTTSMDAFALFIGRDTLSFKHKHTTDADYTSGWTDWGVAYNIFDGGVIGPKIEGYSSEKVIVPFHFRKTEDLVVRYGETGDEPKLYAYANWRTYRTVTPASVVLSSGWGSSTGALSNVVVEYKDNWGARFSADISRFLSFDNPTLLGTGNCFVSPDEIVLAGVDIPLSVGMKIAVVGTAYNDVWTIASIADDTTNTTVTVDTEGGRHTLSTGTKGDKEAWVIYPSNIGEEVDAAYEATVTE